MVLARRQAGDDPLNDLHSADDRIVTRRDGHIAEIIFNNPARHNAMSLSMWQGLYDHLTAFAADEEVRIVVLSGAGDRAFVSGADISEFAEQRSSQGAVEHYNQVSEAAEKAVASFPKPIIAKIDGYCLGGGLGIAMGCDMRFCSEASQFSIPAGKLGLGYAFDGVSKLIDTFGPGAAAELFMTGRMFDAKEATRLGLVNQVFSTDQFSNEVETIVQTIAGNAPLTLRAFKAALLEKAKPSTERDTIRVAKLVDACFASSDYSEGRQAFAQQRRPQFRGQ